jgi:GNAT superfamily N-acetyltransferase
MGSVFVERFYGQTTKCPFSPRLRGLGGAWVEISDDGAGTIWIQQIHVPEKRRGHGTQALQTLAALADELGLNLKLLPVPIGRDGLRKKDLIAWYGRFGFELVGRNMLRTPTLTGI